MELSRDSAGRYSSGQAYVPRETHHRGGDQQSCATSWCRVVIVQQTKRRAIRGYKAVHATVSLHTCPSEERIAHTPRLVMREEHIDDTMGSDD